MMSPMILRTLDKVDQALARLQDLQSSIVTTRQNLEKNGSSERLKISRRSRSPRVDCYQFLGGCRKLAQCTEVSDIKEEAAPVVSVNWRQWSAPAEIVHRAISEILVASSFAKEMATLLTESVERRQIEQQNQEKSFQSDTRENRESEKPCIDSGDLRRPVRKFKVVLPVQGPAGRKEISHALQAAKKECTQTSMDRAASLDKNTETLAVEGSNSWHPSVLKEETSKVSMEATKIKTAQKLWKISFPTKGVMFPNQTFAPSSPPSSSSILKISAPLNTHGNAPNSPSRRKYLGPKQSTSCVNTHQRPLSVGKLRSSPLKSVSAKVDTMMLPTRRKTGPTCNKLMSTSAVSGSTRQPKDCGDLPIVSASSEIKKPTKGSSLSSTTRKRHGLQSVSQLDNRPKSSLRPSKMKILDTSEGQVVTEQQRRGWEKKVMDRRPRASALVKDKENLELQGCTPAALCLKRNWFVGNERVLSSMKSNVSAH